MKSRNPSNASSVKIRVRKYLLKRGEPVSFSDLVDIAVRAGVKEKDIKQVLFDINGEKVTDVDIGVWYGTKNGNTREGETPTRWYCLYPMSETEIKQRQKWFRDFDKL